MEDTIAEKLHTAWTNTPTDRCGLLLEAAQFYLEDGESHRAVVIWKHLITEGGTNADLARLDYAEYLFDEYEDDDAYAELDALVSQWRILSRSWLRAVEMVEERDPGIALFLYMLAMDCFETEHVRIPAIARRYVHLAATCRRLRWGQGIRLTDVDLYAAMSHGEGTDKRWRLLRLIGEPEVIGGQLRFWDREVLETLRKSLGGRTNLKRPAAYYLAAERALRAHNGRRPVATRLESADWTRLVDLANNAKHVDDLRTVLSRYDQGTTVEWPPGRNQPCWCGSGTKYKKCCGANRPTPD